MGRGNYEYLQKAPPTTDGKKQKRDKSALEMSVMLMQGSWNLFKKVWTTRNATLHSSDSYTTIKALGNDKAINQIQGAPR